MTFHEEFMQADEKRMEKNIVRYLENQEKAFKFWMDLMPPLTEEQKIESSQWAYSDCLPEGWGAD